MKHFLFHLMPYRDLPTDSEKKHDSAWVWIPNDLFDPEKGHRYYLRGRGLQRRSAGAARGPVASEAGARRFAFTLGRTLALDEVRRLTSRPPDAQARWALHW